MSKRKQLPTTECQYNTNCYRKNPIHFEQFAHNHIHKIVQQGRTNGEFTIPKDLAFSREIVAVQCDIVEKLFPHLVSDQPTKKAAIDKIPEKTVQATPKKEETKISEVEITKNDEKVEEIEDSPQKLNQKVEDSKPNPSPSTSKNAATEAEREIRRKLARNVHDYFDVVAPKGQMARKLENAAPYNFFLTAITDSKPTHNEPLTVTFMELLDESLGELENSVQINFMVDIAWLNANYYFAGQEGKPMLVLYGDDSEDLRNISKTRPNITALKVDMGGNPFATHHSKLMIFCYKDGSSRIVVSTANLYVDDWHNRTQGLWISNTLPPLPEDADTAAGESPTGFRDDFCRYLVAYRIGRLQPWISRLRKTDFSSVNVCFVASVLGSHRDIPNRGPPWGHPRLGYLLGKHAAPIDDSAGIVAQCSSIGSLGPNLNSYIAAEWSQSFRRDSAPLGIRRVPQFKLIYPTYNNVKGSHDDMMGGGCLPYSRAVNEKQPWLRNHLFQWKSKTRNRNQAMPHIKTYARWTDRGLYWFVLTSANLSKAAWGNFNKSAKLEATLRINNFEAGVLFLPKFVLKTEKQMNYFPLGEDKNGVPKFPMPYDLPLTPYSPEDVIFTQDMMIQWQMQQALAQKK
ncbi:probable tyrosyl-DNA phosphodiesterase [Culicoides brevitarsis]|uniref:probable tyrosyl-DNA phosphodiesterase n=1 Tax=Culicoides brevitarsis TaxID=469753 RepID=UPI00307C8668